MGRGGSRNVIAGSGRGGWERTCIPYLGFYGFSLDGDGSGGKLNADGGLGVQVNLISCESEQQITLSNSTISDEHDCTARKSGREKAVM